jgi:phosphoglycolate phosphatase/pyrophosphatase PpaX
MRYSCLLIDHDDTTVDSTPAVHHKAHLEQMRRLGREEQALSLEEWFRINYHPGLRTYIEEHLQLSSEEQQFCDEIWREFTATAVPPFFPGVLPLLNRFRAEDGLIVIVSHSEPDVIRRHYRLQQEVPGLEPDIILGWTGDKQKNKPSTWPIRHVEEVLGVDRRDMLVVDDLKPGIIMARDAGVDSVGVGWSQRVPELKEDIGRLATYFAETVSDLEAIIRRGGSRNS